MTKLKYIIEEEVLHLFCDKGVETFAYLTDLPFAVYRNPTLCFSLSNPYRVLDGAFSETMETVKYSQELYVNSMYHAKEIYTQAFSKSNKIWIIFKFIEDEKLNLDQLPKRFNQLVNFGFKLNQIKQVQFQERDLTKEAEPDYGFEYSYALELDKTFQNVGPIIRLICGKELGINYTANVIAYFVDLENQIIMNLYDDRGLTITARDKNKISELYTKYSHLLNPHHLESMQEIFES